MFISIYLDHDLVGLQMVLLHDCKHWSPILKKVIWLEIFTYQKHLRDYNQTFLESFSFF